MSFYANPSPTFQPAMRLVTAITNANPAAVTTSFAHDYETGDIVRLYVPEWYGMRRADKLQGTITVSSDTQFSIDIDTTGFNTFAAPSSPLPWYIDSTAHVVPVGQVNSKLTNATRNVL
jgi:hypothetical protein